MAPPPAERDRRRPRSPRRLRRCIAVAAVLGATLGSSAPSGAEVVTAVSGDAYGHYTHISLFGGPDTPNGPDPAVTLPARGAEPAVTARAPTGSAVYGPAHVFGGIWPDGVSPTPPSGPLSVSTEGRTGADAYVTSAVDIGLHPTPLPVHCSSDPPGTTNCTAPGGFGPLPVTQGDEMHTTCTANASGVTGSTRFVNAKVALSTDPNGSPTDIEPVPDNPPPNYTREGEITNVGGNWKIIFNEQIVEADGSITVNGYHMFLLKIAVGEQIAGHVRCSLRGPTASATTAVTAKGGASTRSAVAAPASAAEPGSGTDAGAIVAGAGAVVVAATVVTALLMRRRRGRTPASPGTGPRP